MNKDLSKITIDAPISIFIGVCYRAARYFTPNAHVVKLFSHSTQAAFNIAKRFAISQLSKSHTHELIKACKRANAVITAISVDTLTKLVFGQKVHNLRED